MMEICEMQPGDLGRVAEIEKEIFSLPWSEQSLASSLNMQNTIYLTARMNGEIVGYCGLLQALDEADITNVAVQEAFRRRGVAREMLRVLIKKGTERGITAFTLEARRSNSAAIALYESLGFVCAGIRKNFYERPKEDAVIMWKR